MFATKNDLPLSAKDLIPYVKKEALSEFKQMVGSLPDEEFENWVGKDRLSNIRKKNIAKSKVPVAAPGNIKETGNKAPETKEEQKISMKTFFKNLGR